MASLTSSFYSEGKQHVELRNSANKKVKVVAYPAHVTGHADRVCYRTFPVKAGALPATAFTTGALIKEKIETQSAGKIKSAYLELTIAESGASQSMTLAPVWQWFQYIELWTNNGSGDMIQRIYDDVLQFNLLTQLDNCRLKRVLSTSNCDSEALWTGDVIPASGSRTYRLPLVGTFWDRFQPHFGSELKDIEVRFQCRNGIVTSGSGVPSLTSMNIIFEELDAHPITDQLHLKSHTVMAHVGNLLDWVLVEESTTFTAGTKRLIALDNIVGKVPYLLFVLRAAVTNANNGRQNYSTLGANAQIDLLDNSSQSLYGKGVAMKGSFLRDYIWIDQVNNDVAQRSAVYLLPFCESVSKSNHGVMCGFHEFDGSKFYLSITPDAAAVDEIHTINCTNAANDGGRYCLELGGDVTDSLAFDANAAAIKAAVDALPFCARRRITSTASGALTTDATVTFTSPDGSDIVNRYKVKPITLVNNSLADGGVAEAAVSSVTTYGTNGFDGTGTYTISIYAPVFKRAIQKPSGDLDLHQL